MSHIPITLDAITFHVDGAPLFEPFSTQIHPGNKILIMGANGTGKSTLLKMIRNDLQPTEGTIRGAENITIASVPQTIIDHPTLSGGQRFNKALSQAISQRPDVLCLDEPTNHLDAHNKASLIKMLKRYKGTLIIVSHDPDILHLDFDEIWHIENEIISVFKGNYTDYQTHRAQQKELLIKQREQLQKEKKHIKKMMQKEHKRAASSKKANRNEQDKNLLGAMKESGSRTAGRQSKKLASAHERIAQELAHTHIASDISVCFSIDPREASYNKTIIAVTNGSCSYQDHLILSGINLTINGGQRIALTGDNGSGKSTFFKALLDNPSITKSGTWIMPDQSKIGYLDQHYATLDPQKTVTQIIHAANTTLDDQATQKLLHDFLFITPEDRNKKTISLSGGQKARLAIACISAQSPPVLLLDEVTNNMDLTTKTHITQVLTQYPGTLLVISHDADFLEQIGIENTYTVTDGTIR